MINWSSADVSARVSFSLYSIRIYFSRETFSNAWHIFFCPPFFVIQTSPDKLRNDEKLIRGLWDHLFAFTKLRLAKKHDIYKKEVNQWYWSLGVCYEKFWTVDMEFYLTEKQKNILFHLPKVAALSASSLLMKNNGDCDRLF